MIPLRVTIDLATPWVPPPFGVHLDGLIAWAAADECMSDPDCTQAQVDAALDALPMARHVVTNGAWCWQASLLQPADPGLLYRYFATAKTDVDTLAAGLVRGTITGKKTIDLVRGMTKNDLYRYTSQHCTRLEAWCVGEPERIAVLLSRIQHVGSRGRIGHGTVRRDAEGMPAIQVVQDAEAATRWEYRHLPDAPEASGYVAIEGRCVPPYWHNAAGAKVWRPADAA